LPEGFVAEELRRLGPLPADRAERMVRQAAAGLAAAHAEGIVHRDIKPDNLLLTSDELVKVAEPESVVYALGCVLYQLLTGRPPFVSENPASVMFQHVQRQPTPPTELRAELPSEFEALTLWMLKKDPD
jgi:serine/threonine protein kinase